MRKTLGHQHQPRLPAVRARDVAGPPGLKKGLNVTTLNLCSVICQSYLSKAGGGGGGLYLELPFKRKRLCWQEFIKEKMDIMEPMG